MISSEEESEHGSFLTHMILMIIGAAVEWRRAGRMEPARFMVHTAAIPTERPQNETLFNLRGHTALGK